MQYVRDSELENLLSNSERKIFLYILTDPTKHNVFTTISCAYIKAESGDYFTSFNHPDFEHQNVTGLRLNNCITHDIKTLMHNGIVCGPQVYDIQLFGWNFKANDTTHRFLQNRLSGVPDINSIIPLYTHLKAFSDTSEGMDDSLYLKLAEAFRGPSNDIYSQDFPHVFYNIETMGIHVDVEMFVKIFGPQKSNLIHDGLVYGNYNYFTNTNRPSNAFGGINFAALNKSDDTKLCFTSRYENGILVNMDFKAYHLHLIDHHLSQQHENYEKLPRDAHTHFGQYYFNHEDLSVDEYETSKVISFRNLYGTKLDDVCRELPFFKNVQSIKQRLVEDFEEHGFIRSSQGKRLVVPDPTANKLFNYWVQSLETESNVSNLDDLIYKVHHLGLYHWVPIMYTYDSCVFDIPVDELPTLQQMLLETFPFPFDIQIGNNLKEMTKI